MQKIRGKMKSRFLILVFAISFLFSTSMTFGESSDESQYFFKVGDLFYWQNLHTGETIPASGVLIAILGTVLAQFLLYCLL